jgi:uncharacterized protein YkwD
VTRGRLPLLAIAAAILMLGLATGGRAAPWPATTPGWWYPWAQWRLGEGAYAGHAGDKSMRPRSAPATIPTWGFQRLQQLVYSRSADVQRELALHNQARAQNGLAPLRINLYLMYAAQLKAKRIAACGQFTHAPCGEDPFKVFYDSGYIAGTPVSWYAGENIAAGYATPELVFDAWMNSPGHRANILNGSFAGVGFRELSTSTFPFLWTADFGFRSYSK